MEKDFEIEVSPSGHSSLRAIENKKHRREIVLAIDGLARRPEEQGKALLAPFEGIRSLRAVRSRYRILYRIDAGRRLVSVLLVGERKAGREEDVYAAALKLLRALRGKSKDV